MMGVGEGGGSVSAKTATTVGEGGTRSRTRPASRASPTLVELMALCKEAVGAAAQPFSRAFRDKETVEELMAMRRSRGRTETENLERPLWLSLQQLSVGHACGGLCFYENYAHHYTFYFYFFYHISQSCRHLAAASLLYEITLSFLIKSEVSCSTPQLSFSFIRCASRTPSQSH